MCIINDYNRKKHVGEVFVFSDYLLWFVTIFCPLCLHMRHTGWDRWRAQYNDRVNGRGKCRVKKDPYWLQNQGGPAGRQLLGVMVRSKCMKHQHIYIFIYSHIQSSKYKSKLTLILNIIKIINITSICTNYKINYK